MYKVKAKRPRRVDFDLIVIGTGAGGGVAAHQSAARGKKVAVVEAEKLGGECPNFGCVPTKALLQTAETLEVIEHAHKYGVIVGTPKIDYKKVHALKNRAIANTGTEDGELAYRQDGITVLRGHAHFLSPWTITVAGRRYSAHKFVIASGTHDVVPSIAGLKEAGYIGYREAIDLKAAPKKLFVIGGGAIGCEFGHYFNAVGSEVHIAEFAERLLFREDQEVGELTEAIFEANGIHVYTGAKVVKVEKKGKNKIVSYEKNGVIKKVTVAEILLAAGKAPNTDLGLENAGVIYDRHGIPVDNELATSVPHIFAAGDVTGKYMFTHTASYQSRIIANNLWSPLKYSAQYHAVPRCVYLSPEVASVGYTENELKAMKIKYQTAAIPISIIGRSNTSQEDTGFVKVLANKKGVILGGSIVAPRAGEMIHELAIACQWRMKASKIDYTIHAYPTWSEAVRIACSQIKCR
jgi:dihydrolipoamide dehydrogenase